MHALRFEAVSDAAAIARWRHVHNVVIPTGPLSVDDVRDRAARNRLTLAYLGDALVGNLTVRAPADASKTAVVIARVLPELRRRGYGAEIYAHGLGQARAFDADVIETVVLASNEDGLTFAFKHGFVEIDRYVLNGDTVPYVDLRLAS